MTTFAVRQIKKEPCHINEFNEDTGEWDHGPSHRTHKLIGQPHGPNKNEAKALRRICAKTGLGPDQVREHKKYRQELAQAAGPKFRADHEARKRDPKYVGKTILEIQQMQFAASRYIEVGTVLFYRLWKEEIKRQDEQAILDKLAKCL
jgi:hypothetical protein